MFELDKCELQLKIPIDTFKSVWHLVGRTNSNEWRGHKAETLLITSLIGDGADFTLKMCLCPQLRIDGRLPYYTGDYAILDALICGFNGNDIKTSLAKRPR